MTYDLSLLKVETIFLDLRSATKPELIAEMAGLLHRAGQIEDPADVIRAVTERENRMSTGLTDGIAMPIGRVPSLGKPVLALGIHRTGIDCESMDQKPSRVFAMVLVPAAEGARAAQLEAAIARALTATPDRIASLVAARSVDEVLRILCVPGTAKQ